MDGLKVALNTQLEAAARVIKLNAKITTLIATKAGKESVRTTQTALVAAADTVLAEEPEITAGVARYTELLEKEKKLAKENFVRMCKKQLHEKITDYFHGDDGAITQISDEMRKCTAEGEIKLFQEAETEFNRSVEQKLKELEEARLGNMSVLQKKIYGMEQTKNNLERYAQNMEEVLA
mgnify:CR=1 FL=1